MKTTWMLIVFLLPFIFFKGYGQKNKPAFKIIGYYSITSAITVSPDSVPFNKLTHINLYFLNPDSSGNFLPDLSQIGNFVKAAHVHHVKVLLSIGGGTRHPLYHWFLKDSSRSSFTQKLLKLVLTYQLDGIDVDLEGDDIDSNYEAFVTSLAKICKQHSKLVTAAVAIFYKDRYSDKVLRQFDFMNVMSYDHTGPWDLSNPGPHSTYNEAVEDLNYFSRIRKVPASRLTLGIGFYGYSFGPTTLSPSMRMNYDQIITTFPSAADSDQVVMPTGATIYYNGTATMKEKIILAKKECSGIMIWQLSGDAKGDQSLLTLIHNITN